MNYDRRKHLKLLTNFLELRKLNKNFFDENPEDCAKLRNYQTLVVDPIFWTKRKQFLAVIFDFLTAKIDYIPQSKKFGTYMVIIYRLFEEVDDENCTEEGLRNYLMQLFVTLQNFQIEEK